MAVQARRHLQLSCRTMFLTAAAGWCLVLALTTTALPGIAAQQVDFLNAPSVSECRVHIEAALKQVVQEEPAPAEEEPRGGDQADVESISNEGVIESAEAESAGEESDQASAEDTTAEEGGASVEDSAESGAEDGSTEEASLEQTEDASLEGGDSVEEAALQDEGSLEQADETTDESQSQEATAEESTSAEEAEAAADTEDSSQQADSVEGEQSTEDTVEESDSVEEQAASTTDEETTENVESAESLEQTESSEAGAESAEDTAEKSGEDTEETTEQASVEETVEQESAGESEQESSEATGETEQESGETTAEQESTETAEETTEESTENADESTLESVENAEESAQDSTETAEESTQESVETAEENTQESVENAEESTQESTETAEKTTQESTETAEDSTQESTETAEEVTQESQSVEEVAQEEAVISEEDSQSTESQQVEETAPAEGEVESAETQEQTEETASTEETTDEAAKSEEGGETEGEEKLERKRREVGEEPAGEEESTESEESAEVVTEADAVVNVTEVRTVAEELAYEFEIPSDLRPKDHVSKILRLDAESVEPELLQAKTVDSTLRELKRLYDTAIKPLEMLYKYRDLSNRHFGDPEIFSKPLILFMGPWSGGKSTIINYLMDIEYTSTALRTGAEPSPAYFNILMHGDREEVLDGTQLAADWTFSGLQKFGQGLLDRLRGLRLNNRLLEKVNIVEIPGILEIRKQVERVFPFNDACQWFIDRADVIFLVYDPSKLDVGPETEAILDQLKGREYQTRIILNKADQVRPEELMRVQGTLIWNISPLMSSSEPPVMYSTSLWAVPYEPGAPTRLLYAQEVAFLRDIRDAINKRVENKIASARRFAVRVRNHAKMVDCYLTTYYNHKTLFGNKQKISDDIIERPQNYHIYEGLSTLTNISRYDLPDPEVYRDFFKLNPLYEFQQLSATCTYFRGCPINRLDVAIAYDLPELVGKYKKTAEQLMSSVTLKS